MSCRSEWYMQVGGGFYMQVLTPKYYFGPNLHIWAPRRENISKHFMSEHHIIKEKRDFLKCCTVSVLIDLQCVNNIVQATAF